MTGLYDYLQERMKEGTVHLTLLDPDKLDDASTRELTAKLKEAGTDAFMIGGSTGVTSENLGATAVAVREATGLPTIYFPSNPEAITNKVDGMFFMSILNSTDPLFISHGHALVAPYVKRMGVETIPMAYIIVEPGMTVGHVTKARLVGRDDIGAAVGFALAAQYLGHRLVYLEAGSGADHPVKPEMIAAVKKAIDIPLIVGGGIRTPEAAEAARKAGADVIVTGTFVEKESDEAVLRAVVSAAKGIRYGRGVQAANLAAGADVPHSRGEGRRDQSPPQGGGEEVPLPQLRKGVQPVPVQGGRLQVLPAGQRELPLR